MPVLTAAPQSDGKLIIGGVFSSYDGIPRHNIARLNTDGSLDTSFDPEMGVSGVVHSTALGSDGKTLIGGWFTAYNDAPRNGIARLNTDGSLDISFDPGLGARDGVRSIIMQPDGKIILAGEFSSYNGTGRNCIARLNDTVVGVEELERNPMQVFPSPTTGLFTIVDGGYIRAEHLTLQDATGRIGIVRPIANTFHPITMDLSGQESGLYLVRVLFNDGTLQSKRIMKH